MSGSGSPRAIGQENPDTERVIASRPRMRRSISFHVLSDDHAQHDHRPASAISPVASPVLSRQPVAASPVVDYLSRFEPIRTRHYVAQEAALAAATRHHVTESSHAGAASTSEQHAPPADPSANLDYAFEFYVPAASTPPEAADQFSVTRRSQTPFTPTLYDFVAQTEGPLAQSPQALSTLFEMPASVCPAPASSQSVEGHGAVVGIGLSAHPASPSSASLPVNQTLPPATSQASAHDLHRSSNVSASLPASLLSICSQTTHGPVVSASLPHTQSTAGSVSAMSTSPQPAVSNFSNSLPVVNPVLGSAAMLARMSTHSLLVPQAQQAAMFQQMMGMRSPAPQPVVPGHTATHAAQGAFTAEQQLSIQNILASSIAQALASQAPAPQPRHSSSFVPYLARHAPPIGHSNLGMSSISKPASPSVQISSPSARPSVQLGSGARFQYPLPAPLDPDPKALKWYSWEPSVRAFHETIGFPNIMDPSNPYTKSDHAQCITFLLQMVPPGDADYFVTERATYSTMDAIWSQLVKEYGRHAKARVLALMRTFDAASQASGESIAEYVLRLNRIVKTLKTCRQG
jgi:hypothetical protein